MTAFYNERDPYAAQWLRNLIAAGHIAPGTVDERDIRDIASEELHGFTQCHFFAGIGIWSLALRSAGWPDDKPIWTGSCPCQPFSAAGRGEGFADERHLWPHWFWLIAQCRPAIVLGEQVASKDGLGWLDLVSADLEGSGYAIGAADICAAGFGVGWEESDAGQWLHRAIHDCADSRIGARLRDFADWAVAGNLGVGGSHIRQRLYFVTVADSDMYRRNQAGQRVAASGDDGLVGDGAAGSMDHHHHQGPQGHAGDGSAAGREGPQRPVAEAGVSGGLDHIIGIGRRAGRDGNYGEHDGQQLDANGAARRTNAPHSKRGSVDWLFCRDGKWRAVESSVQQVVDGAAGSVGSVRPAASFPLTKGAPSRVGRLRAYGNGLDAETAEGFIEAVMLAIEDMNGWSAPAEKVSAPAQLEMFDA